MHFIIDTIYAKHTTQQMALNSKGCPIFLSRTGKEREIYKKNSERGTVCPKFLSTDWLITTITVDNGTPFTFHTYNCSQNSMSHIKIL